MPIEQSAYMVFIAIAAFAIGILLQTKVGGKQVPTQLKQMAGSTFYQVASFNLTMLACMAAIFWLNWRPPQSDLLPVVLTYILPGTLTLATVVFVHVKSGEREDFSIPSYWVGLIFGFALLSLQLKLLPL